MKRSAYGFTIVELLIVIVVIAILAAISMVGYTNISNRAHDSTVMADLSNFQKQMELVKVDLGRYPHSAAEFPDFKISKSAYDTRVNNVYYVASLSENSYVFGVRSKSGRGYFASNTAITQGVSSINGNATAQAAGFTGWGATGSVSLQGYATNWAGDGWSGSWKLVN